MTDSQNSSQYESTEASRMGSESVNSSQLSPARKAWVENVTILLRHKSLIIIVSVIVTLATGIIAFTRMPNYYKAKAVILPARHAGGALDNVTSGLASSLKDLGVSKLHGDEESYTPLSLLKSHELMEDMVRKFNFQKIYDDTAIDDAIMDFKDNLDGEQSEEGSFVISFEDTNRVRAAEVTNAVIDELNSINTRLAKDEAEHNVAYVEARYKQNASDLDSVEKAFTAFQQKYGVFALTEQARAELTAVAALEEQKSEAEIQLRNAEQLYGSNSGEVSVYKSTIAELESKLGQMKTGLDDKASSFVPTNVLPDVALQYLSLTREFEIQGKLKAFLLPAFEQAKLDQEKNLYAFVTLDKATVPVHKSRPHRSTLLIGALIGSAIVTSLFVLLLTGMKRLRMNFVKDQKQLGI